MRTTSGLGVGVGVGVGLALVVVLGACDAVIGIPDRKLGQHIECSEGECVCSAGFGDCNGDPGDGCEVMLATAEHHCGACGNDCQNGACAAGACACAPGFVDCDEDPGNGCEAELAADPRHCGTCGHSCLGGTCAEGRCQAFELQAFGYPQSISLVGDFLYVGICSAPNASPLVKLSVDGGKPTDLATSIDCGVYQSPSADKIYWMNSTSIFASPLAGPTLPVLVTMPGDVADLAVSPTHVYWVTKGSATLAGNLLRIPIAGGAMQKVAVKVGPGLAVDATRVYWSDAKGVHATLHTDTTVTDLPGAAVPAAMHVDATTLYVMDMSDAAPGIVAIPLDGAPAKLVAPNAGTFAMTTHGGHLYWLDFVDGNVYDLPSGATTPVVLATGYGAVNNAGIAVDDKAVYWLSDSSVYKMAK